MREMRYCEIPVSAAAQLIGLSATPAPESAFGTSCEIEREAPGVHVGADEVPQNDAPVQGV
jgi:hypothetical protein